MFSLSLTNENNNTVNLHDGINYLILGASGFNPPTASIYSAKSPNRKGVKYNGSSLAERNIMLTIKILGDVEGNRNALYEWIDTEQYIKVNYENGVKNVYCEGHVQDAEVDMFTSNEIIGLAIYCENPYWKDIEDITTDISEILPQFTFPFAIDNIGIPISTEHDTNTTNIYNTGNETGCLFKIVFSGAVNKPKIYNANNATEVFEINRSFASGDVVIIDTESAPKTVKLHASGGSTSNIIGSLSNNPKWFTLKKGNNLFGFTALSGEDDMSVSVIFTPKYLGV